MDLCTQAAFGMFPEGVGGPKAMPKVGAAAQLTNELLFNASTAVTELWKARGYHPKKPEVTKAKLGYALDQYDATAYVVTSRLQMPLLSASEAACIGKRITNIIGDTGTIGKKLKELRRRGKTTLPQQLELLQGEAKLSFAPPPRHISATSTPAPAPPPPPPPPPMLPPPPTLLPPPVDADRVAAHLSKLCERALFEVAEATRAAEAFEWVLRQRDLINEPECLGEDEVQLRELDYKVCLLKLTRAVPELNINPDELIAGAHARNVLTRACPCGNGRLPAFPWVPWRRSRLGFCFPDCEDAWRDMREWRRRVRDAGHPYYTWHPPGAFYFT